MPITSSIFDKNLCGITLTQKNPIVIHNVDCSRDKQPPKHTHLKMLRKKFTMYPPNLTTCYEPHVKDSQRRHQEIEEVVATETKIDAHSVFIKFEIQK